jgi:hypothetical protein
MDEEFKMAIRAFELMPMADKHSVLERFAKLRFPSIADRFHEAVYQQVMAIRTAAEAK